MVVFSAVWGGLEWGKGIGERSNVGKEEVRIKDGKVSNKIGLIPSKECDFLIRFGCDLMKCSPGRYWVNVKFIVFLSDFTV